jgi:alpha-ribazole phosphatase
MMNENVSEAAVLCHGGVMMTLFSATALPRKRTVEWTCDSGLGYTARITPSLYLKSGVIEIVNTIPKDYFIDTDQTEEEN